METLVFDAVCDMLPDKVLAWDLRKRPVRSRRSDAAVLDPETAVVADCEPSLFRQVVREQSAEEISEAMHQLDLERAAQPPVIEVTVTTPPEGIPRAELGRLVSDTVRKFTGPQPVLPPDEFDIQPQPRRRGGKVLTATRRARGRLSRNLPDIPVSEDDTPTQVLPAITAENGFELVEVHVP